MDYNKALSIKKLNEHLIGKSYKNARIDEVIIYPRNKQSLDSFLKIYLDSNNAEKSLIPFLHENDFHVAVMCDKKRLISLGWIAPVDLEYIDDAILD